LKKIFIVGDSHTTKLSYTVANCFIDNYYEEISNTYIEENASRLVKNTKEFGRDVKEKTARMVRNHTLNFSNNSHNIYFSSHPGYTALNFNYNNFSYMDDYNQKNSIVIPWFGYCDIRNWLPRKELQNYKNAKEVVKIYVDKTIKKFENANLQFMEPLPQFINYITNGWANPHSDPDIEFEYRYEHHNIFIEELSSYLNFKGLPQPINTRNILGTDMINHNWQHKTIPLILNDHMKSEYYENILKHLVNSL